MKRPVLRYHGGKWLLAPWIISHFGKHRIYVEPFGGAASVLLRKPACYAEVYNDIDDEVVQMFRVLQDPETAVQLVSALKLTPFARAEFDLSYEPCDCPVEATRRLIIRSFMGFGSDGHNGARKTGFRSDSHKSGSTPAHDWANYADALEPIIQRFRQVTIESRDALEVMAHHDSAETLHYVDPPYVPATRAPARKSDRKNYRHELTLEQHGELLDGLNQLEGMVVLSGYRNDLYDHRLKDWRSVSRDARADGAKLRTETLWLNPAASVGIAQQDMFDAFDSCEEGGADI